MTAHALDYAEHKEGARLIADLIGPDRLASWYALGHPDVAATPTSDLPALTAGFLDRAYTATNPNIELLLIAIADHINDIHVARERMEDW